MTTDIAAFADSEFSMRYKEPFITGGLNKKFATALPRGVYRGFRLEGPGVGDRVVNIAADDTASDHVAVYQTGTGYSLTLTKSADFLVDLSSYTSETVVIAIYGYYAVGATTTAVIRAYTEAEYNAAAEKDELVVLGQVDVPAASQSIDATMVSNDLRVMAWANTAPEAVIWEPLLQNPSFELGDEIGAPYQSSTAFWWMAVTAGTADLEPSSTDPRTGTRCAELTYASGSVSFALSQDVSVLVEEGQRFMVRLYKKMIQAESSGSGTLTLVPYYADTSGSTVVGTAVVIDATAADADYEMVETTIEVPSGVMALRFVAVVGASMQFSLPGVAIRFDDFQVWLETSAENSLQRTAGPIEAPSVLFREPDAALSSRASQALFSASGNTISIARADQDSGASLSQPSIDLAGILKLGAGLINSNSQVTTPRVETEAGDGATHQYTLLWESSESSGVGSPLRLYAGHGTQSRGGLIITSNAWWNGSAWNRDDAQVSVKLEISRLFGVLYSVHPTSSSAPWTTWGEQRVSLASLAQQNTLAYGPTQLGALLLDSITKAETPRIEIPPADSAVTGWTMIAEFQAATLLANEFGVRLYHWRPGAAPYDSIGFAFNCYYDGAAGLWRQENSAQDSTFIGWGNTGTAQYWVPAGTASWFAWDSYIVDIFSTAGFGPHMSMKDGRLWFLESTVQTNPVYNTIPYPNMLYASNMVKQWGVVQTGPSSSILNGFNVSNTTFYSDSNQKVNILFRRSMEDADYSVIAMSAETGTTKVNWFCSAQDKTTGGFSLSAWSTSTNNWANLAGSPARQIAFIAIGKQDSN